VNKEPIVILGARGFIGQALMRYFQSNQRLVIGVSPSKGGTSIVPSELIARFTSRRQKIHTLIVATRTNTSSSKADDPLNVLRILCPHVERLINFSSYAQFYDVTSNATHIEYLRAKREMSQFLKASEYAEKTIDLALYTVIGEGDHSSSFLSTAIRSATHGQEVKASSGEQLVSFTDVQDVTTAISRLETEWKARVGGQYSFWPTPPHQLKQICMRIGEWFPQNQPRILWGTRNYAGHELMKYDADLFPKQIFSDFAWTPLKLTVNRLITQAKSQSI
jgi:nucleoside-diphosphate-sugar epimerase